MQVQDGLVINNLQASDSGEYTCRAVQETIGTITSASMELKVNGASYNQIRKSINLELRLTVYTYYILSISQSALRCMYLYLQKW